MEIKNSELVLVGIFLVGLTLPAKVSRARTKFVKALTERVNEYNESRQEIFKSHTALIDDKTGKVTYPEGGQELADKELIDLANETPIIQATYKEQINTLKAYFKDWDGDVSAENASAYDVFFDALELEGDEAND
ncbi:hypothetical protein G7084_03825 [Weissella coleopterorum]|uniref:Uncharacterized protein n=1 Tax=Weissella coleopterorum TaxID=2714949 RepID=A0A6G8AZM7_9LACO|nr:hypothetical protein [Weissella coleopterorum]QIL50518.1 hypothetical protein G7084_03825 [Weissella coleopterorum]